MKTMKKALSLILAVVMVISCFVGMTFSTSATESAPVEYYEYSRSSDGNMGWHSLNTYYRAPHMSFHTYINYEFTAFHFDVKAYADPELTYFTYKLYKWDTSFEKTMESEPIAVQVFTNVQKNTTYRIEFEKAMPAGEYLFQMSDSIGMDVDLHKDAATASEKGSFYLGDEAKTNICPKLVVYTQDENYIEGTMFGKDNAPKPGEHAENAMVEASNRSGWYVSYGDPICYRVYVNYEFTAFNFGVYTNGNAGQYCTYSLYKWDTSIEKTLGSDPVVSQKIENLTDRYKLELDEPMPAGEYVFCLDKPSSKCFLDIHVYSGGETDPVGRFYNEGKSEASNIAISLTVYTNDNDYTKGTMFSKDAPAPEETTPPVTEAPAPENTAPVTEAPAPEETAAPETAAPETTTPEPEVPVVPEYSQTNTTGIGGAYAGGFHISYATASTMCYRTYVNYDFTGFSFGVYASETSENKYCTYKLYKWDTSFEKTLQGEALAEQKLANLCTTDNRATHKLEFDDVMPAGEYVFFLSVPGNHVYVDFYKSIPAEKQNLYGTFYFGNTDGNVRNDLMPSLTVYTQDENYVDGTMFSKDAPAPTESYVYVNSLDGEILYSKTEALAEVDDAMLAKLNAYANGTYNSFVKFEELSFEDGVHTFYSVHNTEAELTVNGGKATKANGYYLLTANAPEEGKYFAGWYDGDILVSYNETCKFFPDEATESVTAKFAAEAPAKDSAVQVEYDRTDDKLTVKVTPMYGDNNVIVEYGYYIATSAYAMDAAAVIAADRALASHSPHAYMVRNHNILETTQDQNIYLVGFYTYVDGEGETQTLYTELVTVAPLLLADESPDIDLGGKL